jgi:hypothetical protein
VAGAEFRTAAKTLNCVLYTNLRRTATNFCGIAPLTKLGLWSTFLRGVVHEYTSFDYCSVGGGFGRFALALFWVAAGQLEGAGDTQELATLASWRTQQSR